ncbi:hypothetical protein [Deinococcus sonorensis]|uniref:Uncharacterized protein n=2 Tax=Deinococcus sonorensis TaxID=309891 RepID=A0AAU7U9E7_9DEIO
MFGPISQIARDPLVLVLLVLAVLGGLVLHNVAQAQLARRLGDPSGQRAGFGTPEPPVHFSLWGLLGYLLLGLALPRPVPLALRGRRAGWVLLSGPLLLLLSALVLLVLQRAQQVWLSTFDPLGHALQMAALGLTQHALFFVLPLPGLDVGRALEQAAPRPAQRLMAQLKGAGVPVTYIVWLLLALSGGLGWVTAPVWRGLGTVIAWLPL